jgi:hypothetical protein
MATTGVLEHSCETLARMVNLLDLSVIQVRPHPHESAANG